MPNFKSILIVQTAFIGDVILATVVIEKLKQYYPQAKIDFLVRKGNESLLVGNPQLRSVLVWNKKEQKLANLRKIIQQIRQNRYDLAVNLQRFASTGIITAFSGAKHTIGFDKNPFAWLFSQKIKHQFAEGVHEVSRNLSLISQITDNQLIRPKLYPSPADYEQVRPYQKTPYICVAPTSVWFTKQWAIAKWQEFLDNVPENYQIFLLGSPQDFTICENLKNNSKNLKINNLSGKLSLLESAALMQAAVMNYVNDSAPMHLASAMNAPTCVVYCSTVPEFGYGPLAEKSTIVEIRETLPCRPCGIHGHKACPQGHFKCAMAIDTRELLDLI
ncbi:MAG: glycosyltransferase family 9 protein [Microscillaceae bacterium]|jgi:heptosyltransferase-2|nr:glycosyltransferase family 9 protein [Microscillaceae bacterium]